MKDPRGPQVAADVQRLVRRWQTLPLDRALPASGHVRALAQLLADERRARQGLPPLPLPDLGPATAMDQLVALVYDTALDARQAAPEDGDGLTALADRLAGLRAQLSRS